MTVEQQILIKLDRLEKQVTSLKRELTRQDKDEWISGDAVMTLTGWDSKKLRKIREQELLKVRREGYKVRYSKAAVLELKEKMP